MVQKSQAQVPLMYTTLHGSCLGKFLDVTGDSDATYTSLDSEAYVAPAPKKRKAIKSEEQDAKMELWKSLVISLMKVVNIT